MKSEPAINSSTISDADSEKLKARRKTRVPYGELREYEFVSENILNEAKLVIGEEIREMCRPEYDDYVECNVSHFWSQRPCLGLLKHLRKCLTKYEKHSDYVPRRMSELLPDIERKQVFNNRDTRAATNKLFTPNTYDAKLHSLS